MGVIDSGGAAQEVVADRHQAALKPLHQSIESHLRMKCLKVLSAKKLKKYPGVVVWEDTVADDGCEEEAPGNAVETSKYVEDIKTKVLKFTRFLNWMKKGNLGIGQKRDKERPSVAIDPLHKGDEAEEQKARHLQRKEI